MSAHNKQRQSLRRGPTYIRPVRANRKENEPSSHQHQHIYGLSHKGCLRISNTRLKLMQQLPTMHIGDKEGVACVPVAPGLPNTAACVS